MTNQYIIDIRAPFMEFERRADHTAPAFYFSPREIERMIQGVWYCIQHPVMRHSALMDYACWFRDQGHPFASGINSFGQLLYDHLKHLGAYDPLFPLNEYHYIRRHGRFAILVGRDQE